MVLLALMVNGLHITGNCVKVTLLITVAGLMATPPIAHLADEIVQLIVVDVDVAGSVLPAPLISPELKSSLSV